MRHGLLRKVVLSGGIVSANALLGLMLTVLLARALGPENFGFYTFHLSLILIMSIPVQAGLPALLIREVAQAKAKEKWSLILGINNFATALVLVTSLSILIMAFLYFSFFDYSNARLDIYLLGAAIILVPCIALGAIRGAVSRALGEVIYGQLPEMVIKPILLLGFVGALYLTDKQSVYSVMAGNIFSSLAALVVGTLILRRILCSVVPQDIKVAEYKNNLWFKSAIPFALIAGFNTLGSQLDVLMLGWLGTTKDVGIYKVASQLSQTVNLCLVAVGMITTPKIAGLFVDEKKHELQRFITQTARLILLISAPFFVFFLVFGEYCLKILFGASYSEAYGLLVVLLIGQFVNVLAGPVAVITNMNRKQWITAVAIIVSLFITYFLNLYLIPRHGAVGAAYASACALAFWNLFLLFHVKSMGLKPTAFGF